MGCGLWAVGWVTTSGVKLCCEAASQPRVSVDQLLLLSNTYYMYQQHQCRLYRRTAPSSTLHFKPSQFATRHSQSESPASSPIAVAIMSRLLSLALAFLLCTCSLLPSTLAWGGQGHNATARIAQSRFTPGATKMTRALLPDKAGQIDSISSWADQVRGTANYTWSYGLHFADTPDFECNYDVARDCTYLGVDGVCVDGAVRNYTHRLQDMQLADYTQKREALEFFVHFAGDLHQVTTSRHCHTSTTHTCVAVSALQLH